VVPELPEPLRSAALRWALLTFLERVVADMDVPAELPETLRFLLITAREEMLAQLSRTALDWARPEDAAQQRRDYDGEE
jgi:hypothetical protein